MGAYLSAPLTNKESTDEANEYLACGASQMQGWRMSQEVSVTINSIQYTPTHTHIRITENAAWTRRFDVLSKTTLCRLQ